MKFYRLILSLSIFTLLALCFQNCGKSFEAGSAEGLSLGKTIPVDGLYAMRSLACEQDSDCHVAGVGARLCGGFGEYLVYSNQSDPGLESMIEEYNIAAREVAQSRSVAGQVGVCTVPSEVQALTCESNRCVAVQ